MGLIIQVSDGAFFVTSYSTQTITRAYETGSTIQSLGASGDDVDAKVEDARQPIQPPPPEGVAA
jgi:hypothetical protein